MPIIPEGPPLELTVEITGTDGTQRHWGSGRGAGDTPQGLSFRTKQSEGFADANLTLSRRIDREYVDLELLASVVISGADGSIAYEGRVSDLPRSMQDTHETTVQTAGWMAHARDRKAREVYVDRDLGGWGEISRSRRATLLTNNWIDPQGSSVQPDSSGLPSLSLSFTDAWPTGFDRIAETLYDAGPGLLIGAFYFDRAAVSGINLSDVLWNINIGTLPDDTGAGVVDNFNIRGTAAGYLNASTPQRYAFAQLFYGTNPGGTADTTYQLDLRKLTVYGDHGLTLIGDTDPKGVAASDVIRHLIGKYCPALNADGVQPTSYPIPHLVFRDGVDPYDAFLEVNKYHLWQLGVYENRTFFFQPIDMNDYDWEVRLSDPGVKIDLQGDSASTLANGIVVTYQDLATGRNAVVSPDSHPELRDPDDNNPATLAGLNVWTELPLSSPSTEEGALQIGRAALAENNQPKAPGTINVTGHIRDRAGHWQPCWKVRAGDRIVISDHANDRPRRVAETSYTHDPTPTISIAVDSTFKRLDAALDRVATSLTAAGLS